MVSLTEGGLEMKQVVKGERAAHCVFEHIYFSRPDTRLEGEVLQQVRGKMGELLWREAPVDADLVISVPDSGNPAASGFARASGLPQDDGLIKNRYVARTFIQPGQELRKHGLRMKFNPLPEIVAGKRVVVVDDSIVRGNTTRQIVAMLKDAGAKEVHLRISAPPIRHPCHYGVDMSTREEMIAHERTIEEIAAELGADSLAYLSLEGVYEAVGKPRERHCDACFTGDYPLGDHEDANGKFALEEIAVIPASQLGSAPMGAFRIAVLASGTGTNLQAILDQLHGSDGIEVVGGRLRQARRAGARARRRGRRRDRSLPGRPTTRTAPRATARSPTGSRASRSISSSSPATCSCSRPASSRGSRTGSSTSTRPCSPSFPGSTRSGRRSTTGCRSPA